MRALAWLAIALVLAGCSDAASEAQRAADAADGFATLRGVVVDLAIRPVPEARLTLVPGGANATTGDDGQFAFEGLAPGNYAITVTRDGYVPQSLTADVVLGEPPMLRIQLDTAPGLQRFATTYKFEGLYECGVWPTNGCANVNIVTGIMLCATPVPCMNVTQDSSIFLQWVEPGMSYLQAELAWEATSELGQELLFGIGGANDAELAAGSAPASNFTEGRSPLMLGMDEATILDFDVGNSRALLAQVSSGAMPLVPDCVVAAPCGPGIHLSQRFQMFTTTFYGYLPPAGWLFSVDGEVPPPPS